MSGIRFGTFINGEHIERAERLEQLGFDSIWVSEHVFFYTPIDDALTVLAAAAMRTSRVRLGTAVLLLPLRPAAVVAKVATTVDRLSGGRLTLGIGVGGEYPKEFQACGVPIEERGPRTDEAIKVLRKLWTEQTVDFTGRFNRLEGVQLLPPPIQPKGPPIWVGGRSEAAIRRAAKLGDGYLPYLVDPARYARSLALLHELAASCGRDPATIEPAVYVFTCVASTYEEAHHVAAARLSKKYNQPFDHLVSRYCAIGTAEQVQERIAQFIDAGARSLILIPTCEADRIAEQQERYAADVIPHFRMVSR